MKRKSSRLHKRSENQTKKNLVLSLIGIIIFFSLIIKFGIPLLVNFSLLLSDENKNSVSESSDSVSFIDPPILDSIPIATNSAEITVSGKTFPNTNVNIYINGNLGNKTLSKKDGSFSSNQILSKGNNAVKAKVIKDNKLSNFSENQTILFKDTPPSLNINSPSDGQSFSGEGNFANVTGSTDPDVKVTVNDFWAITDESNNFSYKLPLQNGENKIKIIAIDLAGNKIEKEIKVSYSP